ncbi:hypothetical protein SKAU_G00374410 [Synaphobranchus kaupii]|uniref:Uncharacterized protein n=1 Tax=Synaphobranchus kaupii TaxID=118154 RepID=A0A9Q1IFB8_SYNKA|nr:hypothetical protein SKAU_G00374410 [Synaphobranchus kaupii]
MAIRLGNGERACSRGLAIPRQRCTQKPARFRLMPSRTENKKIRNRSVSGLSTGRGEESEQSLRPLETSAKLRGTMAIRLGNGERACSRGLAIPRQRCTQKPARFRLMPSRTENKKIRNRSVSGLSTGRGEESEQSLRPLERCQALGRSGEWSLVELNSTTERPRANNLSSQRDCTFIIDSLPPHLLFISGAGWQLRRQSRVVTAAQHSGNGHSSCSPCCPRCC